MGSKSILVDGREYAGELYEIETNVSECGRVAYLFDTFDDAEEFAENYGGEVARFYKRDGGRCWKYVGRELYAPTVDDILGYCRSRYHEFYRFSDKEIFFENLEDDIQCILEDIEDEDEREDFENEIRKDAIALSEKWVPGKALVREYPDGCGILENYEIEDEYQMRRSHDVHNIIIAVQICISKGEEDF